MLRLWAGLERSPNSGWGILRESARQMDEARDPHDICIVVISCMEGREKMLRMLVLTLVVIGTGVAAVTAQTRKKNPCDNPQSQIEMNDCAAKEFHDADQKLNKLYAELSRKLEPDRLEKLKEAERAWIKFRDADCDFQTYLNRGGTIYPMVYNGCLTENAKNRIKQLEQM